MSSLVIGRGGALPVEAIFPGAGSIPPNLLNQYWLGWRATGEGGIIGLYGDDGSTMSNDQAGYGGSATPAWNTGSFTEPYIGFGAGATSVVAAARLGWRTSSTGTPSAGLRFDSDLKYDLLMATGTPSDPAMGFRYWIGLFNQTGTIGSIGAGVAPATQFLAFRFDNALGDTSWNAVTRDGAVTNAQPTGAVVTPETRYRLSIHVSQGVVTFSIDGANTVQISANVPAGATLLWPHALAIKDATALGQILQPLYSQRLVIRLGDRTKFP